VRECCDAYVISFGLQDIASQLPLMLLLSRYDESFDRACSMCDTMALSSILVTADHIVHYYNVLDTMGHVSVRYPNTNTTFFIALQLGESRAK
jgi:hypothetical protein